MKTQQVKLYITIGLSIVFFSLCLISIFTDSNLKSGSKKTNFNKNVNKANAINLAVRKGVTKFDEVSQESTESNSEINSSESQHESLLTGLNEWRGRINQGFEDLNVKENSILTQLGLDSGNDDNVSHKKVMKYQNYLTKKQDLLNKLEHSFKSSFKVKNEENTNDNSTNESETVPVPEGSQVNEDESNSIDESQNENASENESDEQKENNNENNENNSESTEEETVETLDRKHAMQKREKVKSSKPVGDEDEEALLDRKHAMQKREKVKSSKPVGDEDEEALLDRKHAMQKREKVKSSKPVGDEDEEALLDRKHAMQKREKVKSSKPIEDEDDTVSNISLITKEKIDAAAKKTVNKRSNGLRILLGFLTLLSFAALLVIGYEIRLNYKSSLKTAQATITEITPSHLEYNLIEDNKKEDGDELGIQHI